MVILLFSFTFLTPILSSKTLIKWEWIKCENLGDKLNGKSYKCGSKKYYEWDYKAKKCPQCKDGIIGESDGGVLIMAD